MYADRVKDSTSSTGTGAITLANAAPTGFQTFATAFGASAVTVAYCIADQAGANWEVGTGTFSGTTGLSRDRVLGSSNAGALVSFTAGTKDVFCTAPAKYVDPWWEYAVSAGSGNSVALSISSASNQFFTGDSCTVTLPDVTTIPLGYTFHIVNQQATQSLIVYSFDATAIFTMPLNVGMVFTCVRNSGPDYTAWAYATADLWSNKDGTGFGNTGTTGTGAKVLQTGATITNAASVSVQSVAAEGGLTLTRNSTGGTNSTRMYFDSSSGSSAVYGASGGILFNTNATPGSSSGANQFRVGQTASAVNYVQATGGAAGAGAAVSARGSDTSLQLVLQAQGASGAIGFGNTTALNSQAFRVSTGGAVNTGNLLLVTGAAAGSAPSLAAISGTSGTDANIDLALIPKGTGNLRFGTLTATADTAVTGYIEIKDSGGTVRRLAVIN